MSSTNPPGATSDEGASPREILLGACRYDSLGALKELFLSLDSPGKVSQLVNTATDGLGQYSLHIAAGYGSGLCLDELLWQEGVEVEPVDRLEKDTPLHTAVRYINSVSTDEWEKYGAMAQMLIDAGADPRIRNKAKLKPIDLVDPRNKELRLKLQAEEYLRMAGDDVVDTKKEEEEGPTGSGSDNEMAA